MSSTMFQREGANKNDMLFDTFESALLLLRRPATLRDCVVVISVVASVVSLFSCVAGLVVREYEYLSEGFVEKR